MRLVQFFKWWWDKNDWFTRTIGVICAQAIIFFLSCIIIGKVGILFAIGGAVSIGIMWGIYGVFDWLRSLWEEFSNAVPPEDIAIIRKLKGIPTPAKQEEYYD